MKYLFVLLMTSTSLMSACQSQSKKKPTINETIEQLKIAVNSKDYDYISEYLSDNYQYEGFARPMSTSILKQVIQQFPKIDSISIGNTTKKGDKKIVDVTIHTNGNTSAKTIVLNHENKILSANIAALSMKGHVETPSSESKIENQKSSGHLPYKSIPFYISESQMVVEATINGKKGNFVVDSGTPMALMLNSNFQTYQGIRSKKSPMDVSGAISNTSEVIVESFKWNGLNFNNIKAISLDLDNLGKRLKIESFAGTIGYAILKNYIVEFDYQDNQLKLWANGDLLKENYGIKSNQILPFAMAHHLPIIKAKIGNKEFRFGLDSGAETNMINPNWKDDLTGNYEIIGMTELNGAGKSQREVLKVSMNDFILNEKSYTMNFMFAELYGGQHEVSMLDGLIGSQFLAHRKTAVNYLDNEIYFY